LSYDEEERIATQIYIEMDRSTPSRGNEWVFIRFEVFENCFEFEGKVIDWYDEGENSIAIIEIPKSISVIKNRRSFRVKAKPDSFVKARIAGESRSLEVLSVSLSSVTVKGNYAPEDDGFLESGDTQIPLKVNRSFDGLTSLSILTQTSYQAGKWFDFYRIHAYPALVRRSEVDFEECLELYMASGYFEKYGATDFQSLLPQIRADWDSSAKSEHIMTADYVSLRNGLPVGIASNSLTFDSDNLQHWTFHSLCAIRNDEDLDLTRALYAWRAEYTYFRKENIDTLLFFSSQSRWIERVYVNFLNRKAQSGVLPVRVYTMVFTPKNHGINVRHVKFGEDTDRLVVESPGLLAAALPDFLHIRRKLNCIVVESDNVTSEAILRVGEQLSFEAGRELQFRVTVPEQHPWKPNLALDLPTDRLGKLKKEDLLDFISSLDHSIEVTKRKKGI